MKKFVTYKHQIVKPIKFVKVHKIGGAKMISLTKILKDWQMVKVEVILDGKNKVMLELTKVV